MSVILMEFLPILREPFYQQTLGLNYLKTIKLFSRIINQVQRGETLIEKFVNGS